MDTVVIHLNTESLILSLYWGANFARTAKTCELFLIEMKSPMPCYFLYGI